MAPVDLASMSFFITVFLVLIAGFRNKRRRQRSKATKGGRSLFWFNRVHKHLARMMFLTTNILLNKQRSVMCFCIPWCFDRNLEYHLNLEVWNSFLIMSCLSALFTHVDAKHAEQAIKELHAALISMTTEITNSSATLYAPEYVNMSCSYKMMYCYLLELQVVVMEENLNSHRNLLLILTKEYQKLQNGSCSLKCELFKPVNSTMFLARMVTFLTKLMSSL